MHYICEHVFEQPNHGTEHIGKEKGSIEHAQIVSLVDAVLPYTGLGRTGDRCGARLNPISAIGGS